MLASDATISAHACAFTGDGDGADGQAACTGYSSSRRASSRAATSRPRRARSSDVPSSASS